MTYLTPGQEQFATHLAGLTGLNPNVIKAWTLAEMSGNAATQRETAGNQNWLNIAYYDAGPGKITHDNVWKNPVTAAQATADFLNGRKYGAASGIRAILRYAGKSPEAQLRAIWSSPWASSHYNNGRDLLGTYKMFATQPATTPPQVNTPALTSAAPAAADATAPTQTTGYDPKAIQALNLIRSNAKAAKIPSITFRIPQVDAPIVTDTPQSSRAARTPAGQAALGSNVGNAIVKAAKQFLGLPYSWGGGSLTGPSTGIERGANTKGFDCSGLARYAIYKATGKVIERVTNDQVKQGKAVPKGQIRAGDLIFFGTWDNPHHVAIAMGNGQFIEAPYTGGHIRISSLAGRSDFLTARRYA